MPFFGSVILKEFEGADTGQVLVIDGQQRCTTFSVMMDSSYKGEGLYGKT